MNNVKMTKPTSETHQVALYKAASGTPTSKADSTWYVVVIKQLIFGEPEAWEELPKSQGFFLL